MKKSRENTNSRLKGPHAKDALMKAMEAMSWLR